MTSYVRAGDICKTFDNSSDCYDVDACTWASGPKVSGYCRSIRKNVLVEFGRAVKPDLVTYHVCSGDGGACQVHVGGGTRWRKHVVYGPVVDSGKTVYQILTVAAGGAAAAMTQYPFLVVYFDEADSTFKFEELRAETYSGDLGQLARIAAKNGAGYDIVYYSAAQPTVLQSIDSLKSLSVQAQPKVFLGKKKLAGGKTNAYHVPQDKTLFSKTQDIDATKAAVTAQASITHAAVPGAGTLALVGQGNRVLVQATPAQVAANVLVAPAGAAVKTEPKQ